MSINTQLKKGLTFEDFKHWGNKILKDNISNILLSNDASISKYTLPRSLEDLKEFKPGYYGVLLNLDGDYHWCLFAIQKNYENVYFFNSYGGNGETIAHYNSELKPYIIYSPIDFQSSSNKAKPVCGQYCLIICMFLQKYSKWSNQDPLIHFMQNIGFTLNHLDNDDKLTGYFLRLINN
jgi:hypothetical protein